MSRPQTRGRYLTDDGLELHYRVVGEGETVVFLHALTVDSEINWQQPGIVDAVIARGWRAVLPDARGHGASDRPLDPGGYGWARQGGDVIGLLDHLRIERCVLVGYSLGAGTAAWVTPREPRVRAAVLGGLAPASIHPWPDEVVAEYVQQLLAPHGQVAGDAPQDGAGLVGAYGSSVAVSIANVRALTARVDFRLAEVDVPVLVVNGCDDLPAEQLAALIPQARAHTVPGDHVTAPMSPEFCAAVVDFLDALRP